MYVIYATHFICPLTLCAAAAQFCIKKHIQKSISFCLARDLLLQRLMCLHNLIIYATVFYVTFFSVTVVTRRVRVVRIFQLTRVAVRIGCGVGLKKKRFLFSILK